MNGLAVRWLHTTSLLMLGLYTEMKLKMPKRLPNSLYQLASFTLLIKSQIFVPTSHRAGHLHY
jgi:hypothetical protein